MDHHRCYTETCTMIPSQHQYTVQRFAYASQESMLLHASVESGICARKAWGSRFQKARTATNICFHLLSQATFSAPSGKSPLQSGTASIKSHWSCNVHQKKLYKTACKETWSVAKPGVATDYAGHTVKLLKAWTISSTRESGHHHTQPLWKEIGLNGEPCACYKRSWTIMHKPGSTFYQFGYRM